MYKQLKHAEQTGKQIQFITNVGYDTCREQDLLWFIEANHLNRDELFSHNNDPEGRANPAFDVYEVVYKNPVEILDDEDNFQSIAKAYWKQHFEI